MPQRRMKPLALLDASQRRLFASPAVVLLAVALTACGGASARVVSPDRGAEAPGRAVRGRVLYEARSATATGASLAVEQRPARHVRVDAVDAAGAVVGTTAADELGAFELAVPPGAVELVVVAELRHEGTSLAVTVDPGGAQPHRMRVPLADAGGEMLLLAREASAAGFSGALHILDTLLRGMQAARAWTGRELPPVFAYWGRGVTRTWSYYRGERPEGSGRYCIELLGGDPGQQATSDTDEHDEAIILHELGHFVMDSLSTDSSPGGDHPAGYLIDPGLAWEEGRASWFATAVLGRPYYQDTIGLEPQGRFRVDHDLELGSRGPRGIGSELGVGQILWDLADGAGGLADADADPVALGPALVLTGMMELREVPGAYPAISSFLRHLVDNGSVTEGAVKRLLADGGHPPEVLPQRGGADWPRDVALPARVSGKIDGLTNPAPSGGPNRPQNGVDAVKVYRVEVPRRGRLSAQLRIFGSGAVADRQDLDLELRDTRANLLDSSRGEGPIEALSRIVEPGFYVIYVRDGGNGNRAAFELRVVVEPL